MSTVLDQENRLLSISTPLGDDVLILQSFSASEAVSTLFSYECEMLSAEEGIEALADRTIDVALVDKNLPGMSGLDFIRAVRERGLRFPCFMMTGQSSAETAAEALGLGVEAYLEKPFDDVTVGVLNAVTEVAELRGRRSHETSIGGSTPTAGEALDRCSSTPLQSWPVDCRTTPSATSATSPASASSVAR